MNELGTIHDPSFCDFDGVLHAQQTPMGRQGGIFEARGQCQPTESCLAAFLAAAQRGTYAHCLYNGDNLVSATTFPEMDYFLGPPHGAAAQTTPGSGVWVRHFGNGTRVRWNNKTKKGTIAWAHKQ